jgi:hypothetical protein
MYIQHNSFFLKNTFLGIEGEKKEPAFYVIQIHYAP